MTINYPPHIHYSFFSNMTKNVMLSLLAQGNTGEEIMQILDVILDDQSAEETINEPTLNTIEF